MVDTQPTEDFVSRLPQQMDDGNTGSYDEYASTCKYVKPDQYFEISEFMLKHFLGVIISCH